MASREKRETEKEREKDKEIERERQREREREEVTVCLRMKKKFNYISDGLIQLSFRKSRNVFSFSLPSTTLVRIP